MEDDFLKNAHREFEKMVDDSIGDDTSMDELAELANDIAASTLCLHPGHSGYGTEGTCKECRIDAMKEVLDSIERRQAKEDYAIQ